MKEAECRVFDGMEIHEVQSIDFQSAEVTWLFRGCLQNKSKIEEIILLEYTGKKDYDNIKAFYKDIVEYEGWKYVIEWDEVETGFYLADYKHLNDPLSDAHIIGSCIAEGKIVGNYYTNPELLLK